MVMGYCHDLLFFFSFGEPGDCFTVLLFFLFTNLPIAEYNFDFVRIKRDARRVQFRLFANGSVGFKPFTIASCIPGGEKKTKKKNKTNRLVMIPRVPTSDLTAEVELYTERSPRVCVYYISGWAVQKTRSLRDSVVY